VAVGEKHKKGVVTLLADLHLSRSFVFPFCNEDRPMTKSRKSKDPFEVITSETSDRRLQIRVFDTFFEQCLYNRSEKSNRSESHGRKSDAR